MTKRKSITILLLIFFFGLGFFLSKREKINPYKIPSKIPSMKKEISKLINSKNPEDAYNEIKKRYKNKDFFIQHAATHIFGELLYEKRGKEAIIYCDQQFAFGCYHAVFAHSVKDEGVGVVKTLNEYCLGISNKLQRLGCQHGLGHGIGEFLGPQEIVQQLSICEELDSTKRPFGCFGGVFMEYNFPSFFSSEENIKVRQLTKENIYDPCFSLPAKFQAGCFFRLSEWWEVVFEKDYARIGELCQPLGVEYQKFCLMGIGATITDTMLYSKEETVSSCKKVGGNGFDLCMAGADFAGFISDSHEKGYYCDEETVDKQLCSSEVSKLGSLWGI